MDDFYDNCYSALGLSPEAEPNEVRSAYRRLIKLYHPDHDKSLAAQVKYVEIRTAYDALRDRPGTKLPRPRQPSPHRRGDGAPPRSPHAEAYGMGGHTGWSVRNDDNDTFDFFGWTWTLPKHPAIKTRRPFSWLALPAIFWESVDEIVGVEILARSAFTCYFLWWQIAPTTRTLAFLAMPLSLCGSAVFRYYYTRTPRDKGVYFFASLCYGVALSAAFTVWTLFLEFKWNFLFTKFVYHSLVFYMAMLPLWIHPLIWTATEPKRRNRRPA
ncbi:MAG: DnaJ domain-containing protein [Synergistaceae bacterium]|jgi:hypothetical protein|nr:DnaJ domain-containing protein [Synergistaceae bacterium]